MTAPTRPDGGIDWDAVHARLETLARATEQAGRPGPDEERALLERRARALAQPPPPPPTEDFVDLALFTLSRAPLGVETAFVHTVARLDDYTPVPGAPPALYGVTVFEGDVLPVVDLRGLLGLKPRGITDLANILILGSDAPELAVLSDNVGNVVRLPADSLAPPPETAAGHAYGLGVTPDGVAVLDGSLILSDPTLFFGRVRDSEPL